MLKKPSILRASVLTRLMVLLLLVAVLVACDEEFVDDGGTPGAPPNVVTEEPGPPVSSGGLPTPDPSVKPKVGKFKGCPAEGDGGDPALNRLKNRVDEADYTLVDFDTVFKLTWPEDIERRNRENWQEADMATMVAIEEVPIAFEGYFYADIEGKGLWGAREGGMESSNCHSTEYFDWHVWIVKNVKDLRTKAIIVEPTPRTLALHPGWTLAKVRAAARAKLPVRVSGWLFLDPEHPDQIGKTRGTIWEIHPVMQFEVETKDGWTTLDDYEP